MSKLQPSEIPTFYSLSEYSSETVAKQQMELENTAFQYIRLGRLILNMKYK